MALEMNSIKLIFKVIQHDAPTALNLFILKMIKLLYKT
ncbi:hypothetical protein EZS27_030615, partial [termite gut metagenome]